MAETTSVVTDVRTQVAQILGVGVEEVDVEENLLDQGLDSIRLAHLAQRWQAAGHALDLIDLAEQPTVLAWAALLTT